VEIMVEKNLTDLFKDTINLTILDELSSSELSDVVKIFSIEIKKSEDPSTSFQNTLDEITDTDTSVTSKGRKEQSKLRNYLFGDSKIYECALCKEKYPIEFMVAAHIKPRAKCTEEERKDLNIVMPLCKIGCDELYEKDFLQVTDEGTISKNKFKNYSEGLNKLIDDKRYKDKKCSYHNEKTIGYFKDKINLFKENFNLST